MLNLSQLARESPDYPLWKKIRSLLKLDIYLAENLADYQQNAPTLEFPWYKRFPFLDKSMDRAYIIFQNIGLKKLLHEGNEIPDWFVLHDDSGQKLIYWDADHELFPTSASFDEVQERQGLKEDDWVYDVVARYLIKYHLLSVVEVNKYKLSNKKPKKNSLADRINSFFPEFEPEWQPAF